MRYPLLKDGPVQTGGVRVRIEMIPADVGKVDDVGFGHRAFVGDHGFADFQVFEVLAEDMLTRVLVLTANLVLPRDLSQRGRRSLNGTTLEIVFHPAHTTHFLSAARAARSAVYQEGHG